MTHKPYEALLPQFSVIIEENGVEVSRDILSAVDAAEARALFLSLTSVHFFDPSDKTLQCRVEELDL